MDSNARITKESKKRIKVDYEDKITFKERMKKKFSESNTWITIGVAVLKFILMLGISFVILYPFFARIAGSFMTMEDVRDPTVALIPKNFTLDIYKHLVIEARYFEALLNTFIVSVLSALIQTFISCLVGYGLAKFKFKGNKAVMIAVVVTMLIPHNTIQIAIQNHFQFFDIGQVQSWGYPSIFSLISGGRGIALHNTYWPMVIMSLGGLAFKNGLYIYMMRQFFKGVPDELEESAYVDGSGVFRTFIQIILPLAVPMMITIFLFAFSWQWTDEFYIGIFFPNKGADTVMWFMPDVYKTFPEALQSNSESLNQMYKVVVANTAGMMIIMPLVIMYVFCQRYLVQGIERSGLVG